MIRKLTGLLLAGALATGTIGLMISPATADEARAIQDRERWCRYGSLERGTFWTAREVKLTIRCAARRWPVDLSRVMAIADRESGFNARADNTEGSGACGVFQHIGFVPRVQKFNAQVPHGNAAPSCYNGRANVMVSVRMMHNSGFDPWD